MDGHQTGRKWPPRAGALANLETGRAILRNYINATVGFQQLEDATSIPANSLMRMFGPNGKPSAKNCAKASEQTSVARGTAPSALALPHA
jgi:hypothetical protein